MKKSIQEILDEQRQQSEIHKISEAKINRSIANKEKGNNPEFRKKFQGENNPNYGKRGKLSPIYGKSGHFTEHTEETKLKISKSHMGEKNHMYGKTHTEETKEKIRQTNLGENNFWYGKKHSNETKIKQSLAQKGKPKSLQHRQKLSESKKGKPAYNRGQKRNIVQCTHCNKEGGEGIMHRWHFDNCKHK